MSEHVRVKMSVWLSMSESMKVRGKRVTELTNECVLGCALLCILAYVSVCVCVIVPVSLHLCLCHCVYVCQSMDHSIYIPNWPVNIRAPTSEKKGSNQSNSAITFFWILNLQFSEEEKKNLWQHLWKWVLWYFEFTDCINKPPVSQRVANPPYNLKTHQATSQKQNSILISTTVVTVQ